jgi:hypothetical protein
MKKLLFGFGFSLALSFISFGLQAQTDPGLGGDGSASSICCQSIGDFCQDRYGNAYSDSIPSPGPTCTRN